MLVAIVVAASWSLVREILGQRQYTPDATAQGGPITSDSFGQSARTAGAQIRQRTDQPVLFISYLAPGAYAAGVLANPTRYDYPLA